MNNELWLASLKDEWFTRHYSESLKKNDKFSQWWVSWYGLPEVNDDDSHEYWKRCGFALAGWNAAVDKYF